MKRWLELQTISAQKLITGSLQASQIISSANFVSGSTGWQIDGDGNAEFNDITVRGDIESGNWNGASPANLATKDATATVGFYLDSSVGAAQFMGDMFIGGDIEMTTGGAFRSAASGNRVEITNGETDRIHIYTGDGDEGLSARLRTFVQGTDGTTKTLQVALWAPAYSASGGAVIRLTSESENDTIPPRVTVDYEGASALRPEFRLDADAYRLILSAAGDAAEPDLTFAGDSNTGIYRSAADVIGLASAGAEAARFSNVRSFLTGARNDTTASAANCLIQAADGRIFRSTSSLKYKPDWQHVSPADVELPVPITWTDEKGQKRLGFGAEHVHEALPEAYEDGGENYDLRSIVAVLTAKISRLEMER
jgi:hypothetical protein